MNLRRSLRKRKLGLRSWLKKATPNAFRNFFIYSYLYEKYRLTATGKRPSTFIQLSDKHVDAAKSETKLIAFYLPQFHPFDVNDKAWGKGFTEWTNVSKAVPQFKDHYQPRLPGELGFYDLRLKEVQQRQIELARRYGIYGFCYHHYWFDGKRLMDLPFQQVLDNPELDLPFCLCWANENWTRRWDGNEHEVIVSQNHSPEDDLAFIKDIEPALKDPRYIRINGKALLVVYRPMLLPDPAATAQRWREYAHDSGIGELYLMATTCRDFSDYPSIEFDGLVEFPPHKIKPTDITDEQKFYNTDFSGRVVDYKRFATDALAALDAEKKHFPTIMLAWDNEARRPGDGHIFHGATPEIYYEWLQAAAAHVSRTKVADEKLVFINAWNEWAEGTYLEPDQKYGYAYLQKTAEVVRNFYRN